jgi:hypothetical protein
MSVTYLRTLTDRNIKWLLMIESGCSQHTFTPSVAEGEIHVIDITKECKQIQLMGYSE